jgi:hypothetical protein
MSKAIPPKRIETTDSVFTVRPLASTLKSIPLAFQKRVWVST